jgi:hypothetical protein
VKWAYGVTTVPSRRGDLLPATLKSLADAGFDKPRLFVDGCSHRDAASYEDQFSLPVTNRDPLMKAYLNWVFTLAELYARDPQADRYAVFQDDVVVVKCLRSYLDSVSYPERGYWNLYLHHQNHAFVKGKTGFVPSNQAGKGGLGLVFDRASVIALLTHPHIVERPTSAENRKDRALDGAVVTALKKAGWTEYVHAPSLVFHTGKVSAIGNAPQRDTPWFAGVDWMPTQV